MAEAEEEKVFIELDFDPDYDPNEDLSDSELSVGEEEEWTEKVVKSAEHFYPPEWSDDKVKEAQKDEIQPGTRFLNLNNPKTLENMAKRCEKKHGPLPPEAKEVRFLKSDEEFSDVEEDYVTDYIDESGTDESDGSETEHNPKASLKVKLDFYKKTQDTNEVLPARSSLEEFRTVNGKRVKKNREFGRKPVSQTTWLQQMEDFDNYLRHGILPDLFDRHAVRNFKRKAAQDFQIVDGELFMARRVRSRQRGGRSEGMFPFLFSLPFTSPVRGLIPLIP